MRPIFVVGAARSGTTLTGKIIGALPNVYTPGESHFFEDIWTRRARFGPLTSADDVSCVLPELLSLYGRYNFPETQAAVDKMLDTEVLQSAVLEQGGGYGVLYQSFMQQLVQAQGKSRPCDDTPKHLFHLDAIFAFFPQAKVVICVRDPRAYLASYKNYWRRSSESARVKALYQPLMTSLLWNSVSKKVQEVLAAYSTDRVMLLQYETLVRQPESEMKRLCAFIEEPYRPELLLVESNNSSFVNEQSNSAGIFSHSLDRWKEDLTSTEIWVCQRINHRAMRRLGYETAAVSPHLFQIGQIVLTLPFAFWRAMNANAKKRGSLIPYLVKRIEPLLRRNK